LLSTLTVVNLNDSGPGSLRCALAQAQPGDTVAFAHRLHGTITLTSGELQVGQDVTIQGPGAGRLAISGNHASRVFEILPGADATISGLTVPGGVANGPDSGSLSGSGGGICVDGGATLTLSDAVVTGNTANAASADRGRFVFVSGSGGGIYNAGTLTVLDSTVSGNTANSGSAQVRGNVTGYGGGVYNAGTLTLADNVVEGNTANAGASVYSTEGQGGGIYTTGTLTVRDVRVEGDTANAGAVAAQLFDGSADGEGGGLYAAAGTVTVSDSVFADDTAN